MILTRCLPGSLLASIAVAWSTAACTGLAAGPESSAQSVAPVSRDSAWARGRRALSSEAFTVDLVDSTAGHVSATRYASANAKLGTQAACRLHLDLAIQGDQGQSQLTTRSRWIASKSMVEQAPRVCERERIEVLDRISTTIVPLRNRVRLAAKHEMLSG